MELGKEISRKLFYYLLIFGILFEISLIILISVRFKNPLNEAIKDITTLTETKILTLNEKLNINCKALIYKYLSDLKLIAAHKNKFRKASEKTKNKFFDNYNERKKWLPVDDYNYPNKTHNNRYYDENKGFNYLEILEEQFKNIYNYNEIINELFNEEEFDLIGIYNIQKESFNSFLEKLSFYYISILKSIYIKRYIIKRYKLGYLRFVITINNISFIYPYDRSNNSKTISLSKENISLLHEYNSDKCKTYSSSINTNYITFFSYFSNDIILFCLVDFGITNLKTFDRAETICSEISTSKFLSGFFLKNQEEIDLSIVFLNKGELEPIYHKDSDYYNSMKETFSKEKFGNYTFTSRISLFHILYYRLFSKFPNLTFSDYFLEDLIIEYRIIKEQLIEKINEIEETFCNNQINQIHNISIDVIKTNCFKEPVSHKIKCLKDISKIIIFAFLIETRQLDIKNYIDIEETLITYPIIYSISIIDNNPNITKDNIFK